MKAFSTLFLITAALAGAQTKPAPNPAAAPASAKPAQTSGPIKIGVIDVRSALVATSEGKKAIAALNDEFESRKKDLANKKSAVASMQLSLYVNGDNLSPTEKEKLAGTIDDQTRALNRLVDDVQAEVQQEEQKLVAQLHDKMIQVVGRYASANGFTLIMDSSQPFAYVGKRLDITAEVVSLYDKTATAGKK